MVGIWLEVNVGVGLELTIVEIGWRGNLGRLSVKVSFAGISSGLWLRMGVGLGLKFRLRGGFGLGLGLKVAGGLRWYWLDWFR